MKAYFKIICIILVITGTAYANQNWPMYRGDNQRSGIVDAKLTLPLQTSWVHKPLNEPNPSWPKPAKQDFWHRVAKLSPTTIYDRAFHPIIFNGMVAYSSSADDTVYCLDAKTGKNIWHFSTNGPVRLAPAYKEGRLYVGSDDGYLYCLNSNNGELIWKFWAGDDKQRLFLGNSRLISRQPVRTGVVFKDGFVYVIAGLFAKESICLSAVNMQTGKAKYKTKVDVPAQGYITLFKNKLSFPVGRTAQAVYNIETGKKLFSFAPGSNAAVYDNLFFSGVDERGFGTLFLVDDGKKTVVAKLQAHQITVIKDILYVFTNNTITAYKRNDFVNSSVKYSQLALVKHNQRDAKWKAAAKAALKIKQNSKLWSAPVRENISVITTADYFILGCKNKVVAVSKTAGKILWQAKTEGKIYGLAVVDNCLVAASDNGNIYCFNNVNKKTPTNIITTSKKTPEATYQRNYDDSLSNAWIFSKSSIDKGFVKDQKGIRDVAVPVAQIVTDKKNSYLKLSGKSCVSVGDETNINLLPKKAFTLEAIVLISKPLKWGGIIGAFQDNGNDEHGWVLGFLNQRFMFGLKCKDSKQLTYLKSAQNFKLHTWYHVVATYDGTDMVLYINGKKSASSKAQRGEIDYSKNFFYDIGSYHDDNEFYKMSGRLLEVAVYSSALTATQVAEMSDFLKPWMPVVKLASKNSKGNVISKDLYGEPSVLFDYRGICTISFTEKMTLDTKVAYGTDRNQLEKTLSPKNAQVVISDLQPNTKYYFTIVPANGKKTKIYEMHTPINPFKTKQIQSSVAKVAEQILKAGNVTKGYCYILDFDNGDLALALASKSNLQIIGIATDTKKAALVREKFRKTGLLGTRITVLNLKDLKKLPARTANIITSELSYKTNTLPDYDDKLIKRLLRPNGGTSVFITSQNSMVYKRPALEGAGSWTHIYADRGASANSQDSLITSDMEIQWFGRPGPRRMADRHHRQMPPLYSNGNLFILGNNYLYGVDAYNGTILWERGIPKSRRLGVMYDTGIMAASADKLYIGSGDKCLALDGRSGIVEKSFAISYKDSEVGYIAIDNDNLILSAQPTNASWNKLYRNNALMEGDFRPIACSRALLSYSVASQQIKWKYKNGIIFNPAIVQSDDAIYFLESRNPNLMNKPDGRFGIKDLLADGYGFLVALDLKTGKKCWQQKVDLPFTNIVFLNYSHNVVVASGSYNMDKHVKYQVSGYDAKDGSLKWQHDASLKGIKINGAHGEQWQHPFILNGAVILQAHVIDLATGKIKRGVRAMARNGGGCGTMSCSANFTFQRYRYPTQKNLKTGVLSKLTTEIKPGCWINMIPAGGMVLIPEASSGCTCAYAIQASMALAPKEE